MNVTDNNKNCSYAFYSKILNKPFDSIEELEAAEKKHAEAEQKAKEVKEAKKADALKVEEAFKALNKARKAFKEGVKDLTESYTASLTQLKDTFETAKADIHKELSVAEENYAKALKDFTAKHPEGYHVTLKDDDFETTISASSSRTPIADTFFSDFFDFLFRF